MTTQTLFINTQSTIESNQSPSLSNFSHLNTYNQIDILSDTFANILFDEFSGTYFHSLTSEDKQHAAVLFIDELINANIQISDSLIQAIEADGNYTTMHSIIRKWMLSNTSIAAINSNLQIVKLSNQKFAIDKHSYTMPKGFAFYHPVFGFLGFADSYSPYTPKGGKKVLQSILEAGGFVSLEGMKWWRPMKQ